MLKRECLLVCGEGEEAREKKRKGPHERKKVRLEKEQILSRLSAC